MIKLANIRMLHFVADKVGDLCSEIVFLFLRWVVYGSLLLPFQFHQVFIIR